jgi:hypothetical protein
MQTALQTLTTKSSPGWHGALPVEESVMFNGSTLIQQV